MLDELAFSLAKATSGLPRGSMFIARALCRLRPNLRQYLVATRYGEFVCDMSESVSYSLAVKGEYPHWRCEEEALARIPLNGESVVLDIGANIGVTTAIFARRAGVVHAFEPSPRALAILRRNLPANAVLHPVAVGAICGTTRIDEGTDIDMATVGGAGVEVPIVTVDSLDLAPGFIKIDVEGYEVPVIEGARRTIAECRPIIMFEAWDDDARLQCEAAILSAAPGYTFEHMGGLNWLAKPGH